MNNILNATSEELINILAELGYGRPFDRANNDSRKALIIEQGTINSGPNSGKTYIKVAVTCDSEELLDYSVRIWI